MKRNQVRVPPQLLLSFIHSDRPYADGKAATGGGAAVPAGGLAEASRAAVSVRASGGGAEVPGSIVRSMLGAVRSGFTAVGRVLLPPALQRVLEGEHWKPARPQMPWLRCAGHRQRQPRLPVPGLCALIPTDICTQHSLHMSPIA